MPDIAPRRWLYLYLVLASTVAAVTAMAGVLRGGGFSGGEIALLALFAILFAWIASSFWLTCFGAVARLTGYPLLPLNPPIEPSAARTAILMPVYNEEVGAVFARVHAIWESAGPDFDFYVLSDSTNPDSWVAEELAWQKLKTELEGVDNLFYRHRPRNVGRKSGNIQDFCENWGQLYDYMVILDADSLMTGRTLRELVGLMDANPRAGLIQAPPQLVGRHSLFARIQQFASSVYGPLHTAGLALLQGPDGNYWGHNAIIRVHAFMQHCGLPSLPGRPPFGGEIMSHDFIEAALLRRAGWDVWMAPDIGGSFEEPPPTIPDYLLRDRRWCQGNLQHLRIVFAEGLKLPSRLHLAMGIMSYASSPLWLLLLVASASFVGAAEHGPYYHSAVVTLVVAMLALLFGPKVLALAVLARDEDQVRAHGGLGALIWSIMLESLFSALMAPIAMLQLSWYIFTILMGIATGWGAQQRTDRALPLDYVARGFGVHTALGILGVILLWAFAPGSQGWFLPLLAGLILSIPLVIVTSSPMAGKLARQDRLFLVPSETRGLRVLDRAHALAHTHAAPAADVRALVLDDPQVRRLHLALLADTPPPPPADPARLAELRAQVARREIAGFTREDWRMVLSDVEGLAALS
ncbi:MAG: glucans biosynthesis glucosyltransferase MdoH [Alphaproteobacteria bacterium]|nr:glucans biosynthesis glucosyltransferase MdoH [Alphaproteobacteria bacterium]